VEDCVVLEGGVGGTASAKSFIRALSPVRAYKRAEEGENWDEVSWLSMSAKGEEVL
jgi:hypothetical protein